MRRTTRSNLLLTVPVLCVLAVGCSTGERTNEPDMHPVTGEVTLDGKPLPAGRIHFIDADTEPPREAVIDIINGQFSGQVTAGKKRVEIRAYRDDVEASVGGAPTDVDPQYLPARYNTASEQTADVAASGENSFRFPLTTDD